MAARPLSSSAAADEFFAAANDFASLGLSPAVCAALEAAGFMRPAHVQELACRAILSQQRPVVLAAETGSGKTLAYLAPLVSLALEERAAAAVAGEEEPRRHRHAAALVLCPNAALCEQVLAVARALADPATGAPLARAALVSSQSPPPFELPDVVVTTPGALVSLMDVAGPAFGMEWTRAGLPTWARHVVFDEADMLLDGGYGRQMRVILDCLRAGDKERAARRLAMQLGLAPEEVAALPRHLRLAGLQGGLPAMEDAGYRAGPQQRRAWERSEQDAASSGGGADASGSGAEAQPWRHHWRRQYLFVAATMPTEGDKSVGAQLRAAFPDALWLAGRQLHQSSRALRHAWVRVGDAGARRAALAAAVAGDEALAQGRGRVLVFCRDVASAEATAAALEADLAEAADAGLGAASSSSNGSSGAPPTVLLYHRDVPAAERAAALACMAADEGLVMVCTDAAARGLDLPHISHVIQADFATSAVDFLHRVGRTARAGRAGAVTSLYAPESEALVQAIRGNIDAGLPVEGAFSRNRSFRNKLKKYGTYVPRGQEGPATVRQDQQRRREAAPRRGGGAGRGGERPQERRQRSW
eukprot:scaffold13.g230.t1